MGKEGRSCSFSSRFAPSPNQSFSLFRTRVFSLRLLGVSTSWKLRELSANFAPNVSVIPRRTGTSMGTVDDESRTRTNCSFVRESERNFVVRARSEIESPSPKITSDVRFFQNSRKDWRGMSSGQRESGKSTRGRSLFS